MDVASQLAVPAWDDDGVGAGARPDEHRLDDQSVPFSDAELTELALSDTRDVMVADDAVPLSVYLALAPGPLPSWYMPVATARPGKLWRLGVVLALVSAFVIIEAFGLCSTYGQLFQR